MERIVRRGSAAGLRLRLGGPVVPGTARPAPRRRCCSRCRSSWCSCASRRCTKAGRRPSRCCWWCPSASSVRSSPRWIAGMPNDVFFKVGLITIIGLSAKNAILIVEFALEEQKRGKTLVRIRRRSGATAASSDSDDVVRLHPGRVAAGRSRPAPAPMRAARSAPVSPAACCPRPSWACCWRRSSSSSIRRMVGDKLGLCEAERWMNSLKVD